MSQRFYVVRDISVPANGVERIPVEGFWLTVLSASGEFSLGFDNSDTQLGIEAGLAIPAGQWGYKQVIIENKTGVELTARLAFNDEGIRDNRLVLAAGGGIAVNNFPAAFPGDVTNFPAAFPDGLSEISRHGYSQIGASFCIGQTILGVVTALAGASNLNGCIIRTAHLTRNLADLSLYADTAPPVSNLDYTKKGLMYLFGPSGMQQVLHDFYVPPGHGLYISAGGANSYFALTFDLL